MVGWLPSTCATRKCLRVGSAFGPLPMSDHYFSPLAPTLKTSFKKHPKAENFKISLKFRQLDFHNAFKCFMGFLRGVKHCLFNACIYRATGAI